MRTGTLLAACLLFACVSATDAGDRIRDIDEKGAADCQFLGDISETQYSGMIFAGKGLEKARVRVRNRAASWGATHVLWGSMSAGGTVQAASAKAYRCEDGSSEPSPTQ